MKATIVLKVKVFVEVSNDPSTNEDEIREISEDMSCKFYNEVDGEEVEHDYEIIEGHAVIDNKTVLI